MFEVSFKVFLPFPLVTRFSDFLFFHFLVTFHYSAFFSKFSSRVINLIIFHLTIARYIGKLSTWRRTAVYILPIDKIR